MRRHGDALRELAARYGISNLRFASPGRIVGTVADDRDALDTADFEIAARALLGAEVGLFSRSRARQAKRQSGPGRCASAVKSDDVRPIVMRCSNWTPSSPRSRHSLPEPADRDSEAEDQIRWVWHRLWIAADNEALAYAQVTGLDLCRDQPWARRYQL